MLQHIYRLGFMLVLSICIIPQGYAKEKVFNIGVLYWSMNIEGQVAMRKGLEKRANHINEQAKTHNLPRVVLHPHVAGDGYQGIENQIKQMHSLIEKKVDVIIVQPTDNAALVKPLVAANKANIPVIAYDQYIVGGKLTSYLTSDNYQAGFLDGEYVSAHFADDKIIKLILVEYPHVSSTVERVNGFLDALKQYKQPFKILNTYTAVEPKSGRAAVAKMLQDFPEKNSIDVVFTINDGGGLSVVDGLDAAGRTEIFVASIDGDPKSVENIRKGRLTRIDSAQFCGALGAHSMRVAYDVAQGKEVAAHILVPTFPITKETLDIYPGWLGDIPLKFEKPWKSHKPTWQGDLKLVN